MADKVAFDQSKLTLSGMTMPDFSDAGFQRHAKRMAEDEKKFRARYGDQWKEKLLGHRFHCVPGRNFRLWDFNRVAYHTGIFYGGGRTYQRMAQRAGFEARFCELYGDRYDELTSDRVDNDPRVAELLIAEALRNQRWQELPDELVPEYVARGGVKICSF